MDFSRTEAQGDLSALTDEIVGKLVTDERLIELDALEDRHDDRLYRALAESGVLAAALPESVGGGGLGPLEQGSVLTVLGRRLAATAYLPSIAVAAATLADYGTDAQRALAAAAGRGETVLTAALENEPDTEPDRPGVTAAPTGDGWALTGVVTAVPCAPIAGAVLVPARAGERVLVFAVPADRLVIERQHGTDPRSLGRIELAEHPVTAAELVGDADSGAAVLTDLQRRATAGVCAEQLGVLEGALEATSRYAAEREQFGRPIGSFQAVAQRLADGYIDVKAVRLTQTQAAWRLAEDLDVDEALGIAKFWAAEAGHRVAHTTVHVHGGVGLDRDHPVHRYYLAAKHNEFALGSAVQQLRRLGGALAG